MPARARGKIRGVAVKRPPPPPSTILPEVVYEGRILYKGKLTSAEIGVDGEGNILAVAKVLRGGKRKGFGEGVMLPSATDLHVHFRDPGPPEETENLSTGTLQAALGGVGAAVDMPNTLPPTTTTERVEEKIERIRSKAWVDILPYAALFPGARVELMAKVASGFKLYMAPTTGDLAFDAKEDLGDLLARVASTGLPLHVHAEDPRQFRTEPPPSNTEGWDHARPMLSELSAIERLSSHPPGLRLHVSHATSRETLRKALEIGACTEATPHHLLLSSSLFGEALCKVNPPLRPPAVRRGLWEEFVKGIVPILASDHAPHAICSKSSPFPEAPSGVPGVETMLPLMLERVRLQELELATLIQAAARRPALFLGLKRGRLAPGFEASFLVVNFGRGRKIRATNLHAPCGWTPFEGREAIFPKEHYLRGSCLVEDGEFVGERKGRPLRPALPSPGGLCPL